MKRWYKHFIGQYASKYIQSKVNFVSKELCCTSLELDLMKLYRVSIIINSLFCDMNEQLVNPWYWRKIVLDSDYILPYNETNYAGALSHDEIHFDQSNVLFLECAPSSQHLNYDAIP